MKILTVAAEVVPFAKTGGLADVAGAIPRALEELGHECWVIMPLYRQARECGLELHPTDVAFEVPVGGKVRAGRIWRSTLPDSNVAVYLLEQEEYYDRDGLYGTPKGDYPDNAERFIFLSRGALEAAQALGLEPDVIHCHDWHTALMPVYIRALYAEKAPWHNAATLLTIHNLAYQGLFPREAMSLTGLDQGLFNWRQLEFWGKLNFLKGGLVFADLLNTVSPRYAKEILTEEFGCGLDTVLRERVASLHGVVNGIDYSVWNPETDDLIPANYRADDLSGKAICKRELQRKNGLPRRDVPLLAMISRLDDQKGLDLVAEVIPKLMEQSDAQFVLLGTGHEKYHKLFAELGERFPDRTGMNIKFDNTLAHQIEAGADMFLMPSRYEPCGLNQLYSLRYGTVPIVRKTGGLADTVVPCTPKMLSEGSATGFAFRSYSADALWKAIGRALTLYENREAWQRLIRVGMAQDWSWKKSASRYSALYEQARRRRLQ